MHQDGVHLGWAQPVCESENVDHIADFLDRQLPVSVAIPIAEGLAHASFPVVALTKQLAEFLNFLWLHCGLLRISRCCCANTDRPLDLIIVHMRQYRVISAGNVSFWG